MRFNTSKERRVSETWANRQTSIVTGKSLDSPEKGNVDKLSEKCRKNVRNMSKIVPRHCKHNFRTFFGHFLPIWSVLLFGDAVQCPPVTRQAELSRFLRGGVWGSGVGEDSTRRVSKCSILINRAVPEYCWLSRLVSGMVPKRGTSVFPIALPTVLGDALRLSPNTVNSPDWFQEWFRKEAHRFSQSLFQPYSETP